MPAAEGAAGAAVAYRALPVRLAPGAAEIRYIFMRAHRGERGALSEDAAERTLFVAALPSWCVALLLRYRTLRRSRARARRSYGMFEVEALMSRFGAVERVAEVRLASLPAAGAHVVFATAKVRSPHALPRACVACVAAARRA